MPDLADSAKIRLFASDMDGTLLQRDFTISPATVEAIVGLEKAGVVFAVATGRIHYDAAAICRKHGLHPYIISNNGTCVFDPEGRQIYGAPMDHGAVMDLVRFLEREHICYGLGESEYYVAPETWKQVLDAEVDRLMAEGRTVEEDRIHFTKQETEKQHGIKNVTDMAAYLRSGDPVYSISIVTFDDGVIRKVMEKASSCEGVTVSVSGSHNAEVMRANEDKGKALAVLCSHLGISLSEAAAAGDSINDLEMVREAGTGIAMGNGRQELKEAADLVAGVHTEDGLAQIIRKILSGLKTVDVP